MFYFCKMKKTKEEIIEEAMAYFKEGYACSQSTFLPYAKEFGLDEKQALAVSSTFGGGMGRLRRTCGAVTGAFMVLGMKYGNTTPDDMDSKLNSYRKVRELNKQFAGVMGSSVCKELLEAVATQNQVERREHHRLVCDKCVKTATGLVYDLISED